MNEHSLNKRHNDELLSQLIKDVGDVKIIIDKISNRIFIDNGKPSIQTLLVQYENRICGCEKDIACHKLEHTESSMLIKRPLVSVIIASIFGALTAFITSAIKK